MGRLAVRQLKYFGDKYFYTSPIFNDGIVIIEAHNGFGKSTLMNLIYYCIGGNVPEFRKNSSKLAYHDQIVNDTNNYAELLIEINEKPYLLTRYFDGKDKIIIRTEDDDVIDTNVKRDNDDQEQLVFSDWILEKLDIEVFDLYQGNTNYKINFNDLLRLIYYDQITEKTKIYKNPTSDNYFDSLELRKAIFEILLGKNFDKYYKLLADYKKTEKELNTKKSEEKAYSDFLDEVLGKDVPNIVHLNAEVTELLEERKKIEDLRDIARSEVNSTSEILSSIQERKSELVTLELKELDAKNENSKVRSKLDKFLSLQSDMLDEIEQIKKIRYVNNSLNLFTPDTCPYCFAEKQREKGFCICGNKVDEEEYTKFFYNEDDYIELITSKEKALVKLKYIIERLRKEIDLNNLGLQKIFEDKRILENEIIELTNDISSGYNSTVVRRYDRRLFAIERDIENKRNAIRLKEKREKIQIAINELIRKEEITKQSLTVQELEVMKDIREKVDKLAEIYSGCMKDVMSDVESVDIRIDNYMPLINNGRYSPSSSSVTFRLMYFYSLLYLSLINEDVRFPKLLLIDTPQDKGIDLQNLMKNLIVFNNLFELFKEEVTIDDIKSIVIKDVNFQVILTTGPDIYPQEFKDFIIMSEKDELIEVMGEKKSVKLLVER